jgi:hypothetical protein
MQTLTPSGRGSFRVDIDKVILIERGTNNICEMCPAHWLMQQFSVIVRSTKLCRYHTICSRRLRAIESTFVIEILLGCPTASLGS